MFKHTEWNVQKAVTLNRMQQLLTYTKVTINMTGYSKMFDIFKCIQNMKC